MTPAATSENDEEATPPPPERPGALRPLAPDVELAPPEPEGSLPLAPDVELAPPERDGQLRPLPPAPGVEPPTPLRKSRLRRVFEGLGVGIGLGMVFSGALVGAALIHLDLPASHRATERIVRTVLDGVFMGTVDAQGIEHLGLDGVLIGLVVVRDPSGVEVIRARGVRGEASVPTILRVVLGSDDLKLVLPFVRIEQADVLVEPNAQGEISIAAAFTLRPQPKGPPGRAVHLSLPHVEIGSGYVHGKPDGVRPLDADIRHLVGSLHVKPGSVVIDVEPTGIIERKLLPGATTVVTGTADYHLRVFGPRDDADPTPFGTRMWAAFGGRVGNVELIARGLLEGDHVELSAHAPRARAEHVKALLPSYPIDDIVEAHLEVKGDLPKLDVQVSAQTDHHGALWVDGHADLGLPMKADMTFRTQLLDPRAVLATLPDVRITSTGKVHAEIGAVVSVRIDAKTEPTVLETTPVPAADIVALFDGFVWSGSVKLHEPGAPIDGTFALLADGSVRFDATAKIASLAQVPRLERARLSGAASVHATGTVRGDRLDATVRGDVRRLRVGSSLAVDTGVVRGTVRGPLASLAVDGMVSAQDLVVSGYALRDATARLSGPIARPRVVAQAVDTKSTKIDAEGTVDLKGGAAQRVKVRIERGGAVAQGTVARVGQRNGGIGIEGVALDSPQLGKIDGSLRVVRGELVGTLHGERVDLAALRALTGLPYSMAGTANVDVSLAPAKGGRTGSVKVSLADGALSVLTGVSGTVTATFDGDRITTDGELSVTGKGDRCARTIARLKLTGGDGRLTGPLLEARTWLGATGRVDVAAEEWDLQCLSAYLPVGLPVSEITGTASSRFSLARQKGENFPSIRDFWAKTSHLNVAGPVRLDESAPQWSSRDIDLQLKGDLDGGSGETRLAATFYDDSILADVSLAATLDLAALLDTARRREALLATPLAGQLAVGRRDIASFASLPTFLRDNIPPLTGQVRIDAFVNGTPLHPNAVVRVMGWDIAPGPDAAGVPNGWAIPVDVDAAATYDGATGTLDAHVSHGRHEVAKLDAAVNAPLEQLLGGAPATSPAFSGRARLVLSELPVADIPALGDRSLGGHVSGEIALDGIGEEPSLAVDLRTSNLSIGPTLTFREGHVTVRTQRGKGASETTALATAHLVDLDGGRLDASGYLNVGWSAGLVPVPLTDRPSDLYAKFSRFRLTAAEPLVFGILRKLDGLVDGEVRIGWGRLDQADKGALDCDLRVTDGSFYVPQIGQEFRIVGDTSGPLRVVGDRAGTLRIENIVAQGNSGKVRGWAIARLDGLAFKDAAGELAIVEDEALPITLEGVPLGEAWGTLKLGAASRDNMVALDVHSSNLHLALPASSSRDVQSLEPNPDISPSHTTAAPEQKRDDDARRYGVTLHLQNAVVEGAGIRIVLSSVESAPPTVVLSDETRASGDIRLERGTIEVIGRKFELEQGVVRLREEDPSNPYLNVTALWDAPDGSRVFVDYVGVLQPITHEKLRFRSNPPRSQQETLALLLFGSDTGTSLGGGSSTGSGFGNAVSEAAVGIGGELIAARLNQVLSGIAPLKGFSARFGSGEGGGIKTSLVYQLGDTVTAAASVEGDAPAGGATSTTTSSGTSQGLPGSPSISIDWRFYKNWLIRAGFGSSANVPKGEVDLLWQYRY